jgi:protein ImuB
MQRVASLYLPNFAIDRLRRIERAKNGTPPRSSPAFVEEESGASSSRGEWWPAARLPENTKERAQLVALRERLEQERKAEAPPEPGARIEDCSCPRGGGWRPGARWSKGEEADEWLDRRIARKSAQKAELQARIETLPLHQRPPMRELGRRSEPAEVPFRRGRGDAVPLRAQRGEGSHLQGGGGVTVRPAPLPLHHAAHGPPPHALHGEEPVVTAHRSGSRIVLAAACPGAQALGLHPGMPLTQARAMVPGLDIREADPVGDAADLDRLALHAARHWTPLVMTVPGEGLWLDITAGAHLFGGERMFARRVLRFCSRIGLTARIAIAGTAAAALALARCSSERLTLCPPGREAEEVAALPLSALRIDSLTVETARRLGIETIGALAAMPRAPLVRRFGGEIITRLDELSGARAQPIDLVVPQSSPQAGRRFAEPIMTAEAIGQVLAELVGELTAALGRDHLGARTIALTLTRIDAARQCIEIGFARPSRDADHIFRLLSPKIETIEPGFGIEAMLLVAARAEPLAPQPIPGELSGEPPAPDLAPLIDTLAGRLGDGSLFRVSALESDVPERSVRRVSPLVEIQDWPRRWPRPARLLVPPERVEKVMAELPDQAPIRFFWRGRMHRVRRADGPERIYGEWWRKSGEADAVRDYFQVEDEAGARFWLYRRGDGLDPRTGDLSWHMQGMFG